MSRSRRRTPICGYTNACSDHAWKQAAARKLRRYVRQTLKATNDGDQFSGKRWELVNPWSSDKDGKHWFATGLPKLLRK